MKSTFTLILIFASIALAAQNTVSLHKDFTSGMSISELKSAWKEGKKEEGIYYKYFTINDDLSIGILKPAFNIWENSQSKDNLVGVHGQSNTFRTPKFPKYMAAVKDYFSSKGYEVIHEDKATGAPVFYLGKTEWWLVMTDDDRAVHISAMETISDSPDRYLIDVKIYQKEFFLNQVFPKHLQ